MQKTVCLLLAVLLCLTTFPICASAASDDLHMFVTSDVHWKTPEDVAPDGFFRPRDDLGQMTSLAPAIFTRFLQDAAASDVDCVLLSGDMTNFNVDTEVVPFTELLADFEAQTGKQIYVVPGNHDIDMNNDPNDHLRFRRNYSRFGYEEAIAVDEATSSYTADLNDTYRLLAINSNKPDGGGVITDAQLAWIEAQAKQAKADGKNLIAMMHHHLMEHLTLEQTIDGFYILDNYKQVCRLFDKYDIRLTFTGHLHLGDIAAYKGIHTIYDVTTASLATYPLTYRDVTLTDKEIRLESRTIDKLDEALIPQGYSAEQREMIVNDPVRYAYGCVEDSLVGDYIGRFVDLENLIDMLGLEPDSVGAKAIRRILPDVLIPLYGEGETVEAKAKALGYTLPESDYETVGDLITAFWAAMTRGDENFGGSSPEGKLFLDAAYALFAAKAAQESPVVRALLSAKIIARLGLKGVNNIFTRKALDLILTGLMVDKGPTDNDVTLPGYGAITSGFLYGIYVVFQKILQLLHP